MVFGKLSDFDGFPPDAILSNLPVCATPSFGPLNICTCIWKFTSVVCSCYSVFYELTFVSVLVLWPLIIVAIFSNQDPN